MSMSLKLRQVLVVAAAGLLLTFQNCAQAPEEPGEENTELSHGEKAPFAVSMKLDTISHMSCSNVPASGPERRAYFSFRAGAYNKRTGGLTLTPEFIDHTRYYDVNERARAFSESVATANTRPSLSIRSVDNYQIPWEEGQKNVGEEIDSLLPPLDSAVVAGPLSATATTAVAVENKQIQYFPGSQTKRLLEGSLRYYHYENTVKETREALAGRTALLVAGFSNSTSELDFKLRGPNGVEPKSAFGTGYYLRFGLPNNFSAGELRVLDSSAGVEEVNLLDGSFQSSNWDCSVNYRFMVVRPEDTVPPSAGLPARTFFNPVPDRANTANQAEVDALNFIRRVLRVEDWYVDLPNRRIMPKRTGDYCYGPLNGRVILYDQTSCTMNSATGVCPHYVSVCVKR